MNIKKIVEEAARKNTYTNDWLYSFYQPNREKQISGISCELSKTDSLMDIEPLKEYRNRIDNEGQPFWSYNLNKTESRMYGIHKALFGDINDKEVYFPSAEHGLIFHNSNWSDTENTVRASCVTFGDFRKEILQKFYDTPVFCVGPYIHYAEDYYKPEKFFDIKNKIGKNLLVFPTHGTDDAKITYSEKCFADKIFELKNDFDSVTVCVFWWNLNDPMVSFLREKGCHIVSAGYREDPNFLSRLKTIIDLSDLAIGDSIGTNVGYCISRNKPFAYFESETDKKDFCKTDTEDERFVKEHTDNLKNIFKDAYSIGEAQLKACNYYWGLDKIKTREQLHDIYNANKKITIACNGWASKYANCARQLLSDTSKLSKDEIAVLSEALKR